MNIANKIEDLRSKDQALLDGLDAETQAAVARRIKATAMAAGMHEVLGSCASYGEAQLKAAQYVYEDAVQPKPKMEQAAA